MENGPVYISGIIHFDDYKILEESLASLLDQSLPPERIVIVDHSHNPEKSQSFRSRHDTVDWICSPNGGYASGANRVIGWAESVAPDSDYVLVMNPDVNLESEFSEAVIREMQARPRVALASGRLLRPGGTVIDSAGIEMHRSRRFRDRGSEESDEGQFGASELVFAVSGAAMMLRRSALAALSLDGEIFDEDFFVYHEDTDLAWRAHNLGYSSLYVADAVAIHVRGWRQADRKQIALSIRRHSLKNRYLEIIKNDVPSRLLRDFFFIFAAEFARLVQVVFLDRGVLGGYKDAAKHARRAWRKRRMIQHKIRANRKSQISEQ